jgi:hypothetical protein
MNRVLLFICIAAFFSCEREKLAWEKEKIVPKLSGCIVSNITATSVQLDAKTLTNGGLDITEYGFCFSEGDTAHFIKENKVICTPIDWKMKSQLQDLKDGTKYYVKAYAINSAGIGYSEAVSFTTKLLPIVVTDTAINNVTKSAEFSGVVLFDGGIQISERGICISYTWQFPTIEYGNSYACGTGVGAFSTGQINLVYNVKYNYRAYAKTIYGVVYGKVKTVLIQ